MIRLVIDGVVYPEQWVNWNEETQTVSRSETYHGVIITKTIQISVIEDAYQAIKAIDDTDDLAGELPIKTQVFDNVEGWQDDFIGFVDFETINYSTEMTQVENNASKTPVNKVTFSAYSSSFANDIIARQEIEIPYDRLETLDGEVITPFTKEYEEVNIDGIEVISTNIGTILPVTLSLNALFPGISNSSTLIGWVSTTLSDASGIGGSFEAPNDEWVEDRMFWNDPKTVGNMSGNVKVTYTASTSGSTQSLRILDYKELIPVQVANTTLFYSSGQATIELDFDYDITNESRLVLYLGTSAGAITELFETECNFDLINIAASTPCNFVPPFEMGTRIIESITGQTNGLDSPFFGRTDTPTVYDSDGEGSMFFHTNGRLIRQFPIGYQTTDSEKKSQLTNSLMSWFKSLDNIFCLGAGVKYEDEQYKLYVDDRKEFYKNEVSLSLTLDEIEIDTYSSEKDLSLYINEIEAGSTYENPEETSALEEYNNKQKYSSLVPNKNKYDLANDNVYAAYPFEFARRLKYDNEQTTDYKYDGNNFIFNVERDEGNYKQLSDTDFEEINGLEGITSYINLNITPKRIIEKNHGWYINSGFKGFQGGKLTYNKSDKTITDLSTRKVGEADLVVENEDVLISKLESPKFTGKKITFTARISSDKFKNFAANPYGLIEYPDLVNGGTGYGYIPRGGEISTNLTDKTTNVEVWETTGFSEEGNFILLQDGNNLLTEEGGRFQLED